RQDGARADRRARGRRPSGLSRRAACRGAAAPPPLNGRTTMAYEDIRYETRDGVAWITIDRPAVRNAFRTKTVDELIAAFRAAWADADVGVVVLTGAGDKAFSAGGGPRAGARPRVRPRGGRGR